MTPSIRRGALCAALACTFALSGCLPIAATGVAMGAMAVSDRRSIGTQTEDEAIELKARNRLRDEMPAAASIEITSYNRRVLLTGQVPDDAARRQAEAIVNKVDNVSAVYNELQLGFRPSIGTRTSDATTTARVKAALVEAKDVQAHAVKVVTEQGVVYLMGLVTQREGDRAAQVAARVGGVQRVVTVFQYLTEEELSRLGTR